MEQTGAASLRPNAREAIVEAALELFSEQGYGATSLQQVADRVGIRKPSLFYHFASKAELADVVFERVRQQLITCLAPLRTQERPGPDQLTALIDGAVAFCAEHRSSARLGMRMFVDDLARVAGIEQAVPRQSYVDMFAILGGWLERAKRAGVIRPLNVRVGMLLILGTVLMLPATAHDAARDLLGDPWSARAQRAWKRELTAYLLGALGMEAE